MLSRIIKHPLFKSSLIYTLCDALNKAVPFLVLPLLSYYLTPGDYGIVANFNVLLPVLIIVITIGLDSYLGVNFYRVSKEVLAKYIFNGLLIVFFSSFIALALMFVCADTIYLNLKIPFEYTSIAVLMAVFSIFSTLNLTIWRLEEKQLLFGTYQILQTVVNIGCSLVLVIVYRLGWIGRIEGMLISILIFGSLSVFILIKRKYVSFSYDRFYCKQLILFGLPLIPHGISFWIRSGVDRLFITRYIGESETGIYATGFQFGVLVSFCLLAFNNAYVPFIYKSLSNSNEEVVTKNKLKLVKLTYVLMVAILFLSIVFYVFSKIVLKNMFSVQYHSAEKYIGLAILAQIFYGYYLLFVNYIFYTKNTKGLAIITFSSALLHVFLSYFLVHLYGGIGAAYSSVIVSFLVFIMVALYSARVVKMPWKLI